MGAGGNKDSYTLERQKTENAGVAVWLWPATKDHIAPLSPLPPPGWGEEWKEKGKNLWVGIRAV